MERQVELTGHPTGNFGSAPSDLDPVTLETPTLKGEVYTTGRGGSGNMARNDDPAAARRAQDVVGYETPSISSPAPRIHILIHIHK